MGSSSRFVLATVIGVLILGVIGTSEAQLVMYDDFGRFGQGPIDPARWWGTERVAGAAAPNTETVRGINRGRLNLGLVSYGRTDSDSGTGGSVSNNLFVTDPVPITTIQADVIVTGASATTCTANPTGSVARARVQGEFFNDGTSSGPGDRIGDVGAVFDKTHDSLTGDRLEAVVYRCSDASCTNTTTVAYYVFSTGWTLGVADTLQIQWDAANNQFLFAVKHDSGDETIALSYTDPDALPPALGYRGVGVSNRAANCTAGRQSASIQAAFDNVKVNP